jgi:tetratricopeptide (TPR) repeat protein
MIEALLQAERLLVHGLVDQAERIYEGALAQDPLNAIAVVGLARVALERGDDRLALEHAQKALQIDPQNTAALRLEQRLSEVLRARGGEPAGDDDAGPASSPGTEESGAPVATPDAKPSEQFVFNRNPSMADHRAMEERRGQKSDEEET